MILFSTLIELSGQNLGLKCTFEIMELDDECVAVPILESADEIYGVIKLNDTNYRMINPKG